MSSVLLTGGCGYIGSHTCVELLEAGHQVILFDNLSNSDIAVLDRIKEITGKSVEFIEADVTDKQSLSAVFQQYNIDSVIHFAGLKAVGESVKNPLAYYNNNVSGSISLLEVMAEFSVKQFVFSSSATVYGDPAAVPITEATPVSATNPYGWSKLMVEQIMRDLFRSDCTWKFSILRYFNPIGAHDSGLIGENPSDIPNNLMPYITQVAIGKLDCLYVFGDDYATPDGTGVRDYIHVVDLARGHVKALDALNNAEDGELSIINLGTGRGCSVLDMISTFQRVTGVEIPYRITGRRSGDIAECYADPSLAKELLDWVAEFGIEQMCRDAWRWQVNNPDGYSGNIS